MGARHGAGVIAAAATLLLAMAAAPAAHAALGMHRCFRFSPILCGSLTVPLDRSGAVPGRITLHIERVAARRPTGPPVFFLSGGPGQAADDATESLAHLLKPALRHRDLVVFDQRGTGLSGALNCPALERADPDHPGRAPSACASALGRRRPLYTTAESVADMDAVRAALGYNHLALFGVSYGTKVALAYARAYPQHLDRLIIDSVVVPDGPDPLSRSSFEATPRILRAVCGRACASFTADPAADLRALVARMSHRDLTGVVYGADGRGRPARLDRNRLFETIFQGDVDPTLRGELPADVHAALKGDAAPLLRLAARALPHPTGTPYPKLFSATLFTATICAELPFPWVPSASPPERATQAALQVGSMPASVFTPFDAGTAVSRQLMTLCRGWPGAGERFAPASGPLPSVPALVISGRDDVRTPLEDARATAARLPGARTLVVSGVGHSVVGTDPSGCAGRQVVRFLQRQAIRSCPGAHRTPVAAVPPRRLSALLPLRGLSGARGRAARALLLTAQDTVTYASRSPFGSGGGLRGGRFRFGVEGLQLVDVVYIPGVRVTGSVNFRTGIAELRFTGTAGRGSVSIGGGSLTGTISGHRVRVAARLAIPASGQGAGSGLGQGPPGPWPVT